MPQEQEHLSAPPKYQDRGRSIYHLHPLEEPTLEIRLLKLRRRAFLIGQVQYSLEICYLESAPAYRAISYTWGDPSLKENVLIGNQEIGVRQNCHYALTQVRQHWPGDYIWIDSICIDQQNLAEKNAQVQMMGRIYSNARSVSACLGPHYLGSQHLVKNLKSVHGLDKRSKEARQYWINRPYWFRLWIVQELCLAKEIHVHCGSTALPWADVYKAIVDSGYETPYVRFLGDLVNKSIVNQTAPALLLQEHTKILRDAKCADPRDKIFGMLNLIRLDEGGDFDAIRVDYAKPAWQLALDVAQRPSTLFSFSDQVAHLLPLLEVTARDSKFRAQVKLRSDPILHTTPHKKHIQRIEELCADLVRHSPEQGLLDVRRLHPGWVSGKRSCKAVRLCSRGTECVHTLYIQRTENATIQKLPTFIERLKEKPTTRPDWYSVVPKSGQGFQAVYAHQKIVAVVCQEARDGDVLVFSQLTSSLELSSCLGEHLFIARRFDGDVYHIIGQGFFLPGLSGVKELPGDAVWLLDAEDAMTATAHLQFHECSQSGPAAGRCKHWFKVVRTAIVTSPLSSFVFYREPGAVEGGKLETKGYYTACSICAMDPQQTPKPMRVARTLLRSVPVLVVAAFVALALHPAIAALGLFLYYLICTTDNVARL